MIHEKNDQFEAEVVRMKPRAKRILQTMQVRPTVLAAVRRYFVPQTRADAIEGLLYTLPPVMLEQIKVLPQEELITLHHSLGREIRNLFRLWQTGDPLVGEDHPDDASMAIIGGLWEALQG